MKPQAASCAVGSGLRLLFTFHKSFESFNRGCKALGPRFHYSSDILPPWLSLCLNSYCWFSSRYPISWAFFFAHERICMLFHEGWSNDKMSCDQWAVDRTLLTWWKQSPLTVLARFRPPGQGRRSTKSALSLSGAPRVIQHGPCSPQQHHATNSTSSVRTQL